MATLRKKHPMTLIEIMIVIFIIGIIGSVIGYNMKGSLEEGKAFKSEQGSKQVYDILTLEIAKGSNIEDIVANPGRYLENSGFAKNPKKLLQDGWGQSYTIKQRGEDDLFIVSDNYLKYLQKKKQVDVEDLQEKYPWMADGENEILASMME